MKIKPLFDRIVVEEIKEEKTGSGIFLASRDSSGPRLGTVICVGNGEQAEEGKKLNIMVKEGDKVLFNKYAGAETTLSGKSVIFIRQADILAILE